MWNLWLTSAPRATTPKSLLVESNIFFAQSFGSSTTCCWTISWARTATGAAASTTGSTTSEQQRRVRIIAFSRFWGRDDAQNAYAGRSSLCVERGVDSSEAHKRRSLGSERLGAGGSVSPRSEPDQNVPLGEYFPLANRPETAGKLMRDL